MVKKILSTFVIVMLAAVSLQAQAPVRFNYQSIVRDVAGNLVGNHLVHVKISIIAGSFEGEVVYAEHSSAMTDRSGLMSVTVGDGVVLQGQMESIDWSKGPYFMRCDIDPKGGNSYAVSSAQQLVSVPYALYAGGGDYRKLSNLPDLKKEIRAVVNEEGSKLYQESQGLSDVVAIDNNMGYRQLKTLGDPTDEQDATTVAYVRRLVDSMMARVYDSCLLAVSEMMKSISVPTVVSDGTIKKKALEPAATLSTVKNGLLTGVFSVAEGKKVQFAQGNLQYSPEGRHAVLGGGTKEGTWRFASTQYEEDSQTEGCNSLLVWGSTGCDDNSAIGTACNDWGLYNAVSNGGNLPGQWRLLSIEEWNYLRLYREGASRKQAMATVAGRAGVVFLPDSWSKPAEVTFVAGAAKGFNTNVYDAVQWTYMEAAGAVFLPADGSSNGGQVSNYGSYGSYWTSSVMPSGKVYSLDFYSSNLQTIGNHPKLGQSVRLVQDKTE